MIAKKPAPRKKPVIAKPVDYEAQLKGTIKTLEADKDELKADLKHAIDDCSEWVAKCRVLEGRVEQLETLLREGARDGSAQTARLHALLKPFVACAKGESLTVPADWEALKAL